MKASRLILVKKYIKGYNAFDIDMMLSSLHEDVVFENITNGEISLSIKGISNFKKQAQSAMKMFSSRHQNITGFYIEGVDIVVEIEYSGILAKDLSKDLKKNDEIKLKGKSIFTFTNDKISKIVDIS